MAKQSEKEIIIDGVHYKMPTWSGYSMGLLREFLMGAPVVKDDKAPQAAAPVQPIVKEQLTDIRLKAMFGADKEHVCVYDIEFETFLLPYPNIYNGQDVVWYNQETADARKIKEYFEKEYPEFEVVAQVNKQVSEKDYPGCAKWSKGEIKFNMNGECTVGTLVIRNKKTGELQRLNGSAWFGVQRLGNQWATRYGALGLVNRGARDADFRAGFFAPFMEYVKALQAAKTR